MAKGFHEFQKFSPENLAKAAAMFEQALVIDPDYLAPLMASAYCYGHLAWIADGDAAHCLIERAQAAVDRSVAQAPDDVRPYAAMRAIEFARGNHDAAVAVAETALAMAPNDSYCRATLAFALTSVGRPAEALAQMTMAARDIPTTPGWFEMNRMKCHHMQGDLTEAIRIGRKTVDRLPDFYPGSVLVAAFAAELGFTDEAAAMGKIVLEMDPQFSARTFVRWQGLKDAEYQGKLQNALSKAGLPD